MVFRNEASKGKNYSKTPQDLNDLIKEALMAAFEEPVENETRKVTVAGRIYPEELLIKVTMTDKGNLRCHNFSGSMDHSVEKGDLVERMQNLMEAIGSMMIEFISADGDIDMPQDWHEYDFQQKKLHLMYSTENESLEAQAQALLGDDFNEEDENVLEEEFVGQDFFKEAEERFKTNLH